MLQGDLSGASFFKVLAAKRAQGGAQRLFAVGVEFSSPPCSDGAKCATISTIFISLDSTERKGLTGD